MGKCSDSILFLDLLNSNLEMIQPTLSSYFISLTLEREEEARQPPLVLTPRCVKHIYIWSGLKAKRSTGWELMKTKSNQLSKFWKSIRSKSEPVLAN